ncbi:MAG: ATP-binding protein [Bacteriovoracaceae bacterium]
MKDHDDQKLLQELILDLEAYSEKNPDDSIKILDVNMRNVLSTFSRYYLFFDKTGRILDFSSPHCHEILTDDSIIHKKFLEILGLAAKEIKNYKGWIKLFFTSDMSFEEIANLGPKTIKTKKEDEYFQLNYRPIYNNQTKNKKLLSILVIIENKTFERKEQSKQFEKDKKSEFLLKAFTYKNQFSDFIQELKDMTKRLKGWGKDLDPSNILEAKRLLHTLSGAASYFHLTDIQNSIQSRETQLKKISDAESILKDDLTELFSGTAKELNDFYEELYRNYSPLLGQSLFENQVSRELPLDQLESFYKDILKSNHTELASKFLNEFLKTPIEQSFRNYEGHIQELSHKLGKKILPLEIKGKEVLVYEPPYKNFFASLIHIFNNIIDHGIEDPFNRTKAKKPLEGKITIEIIDQAEHIEITIADDGKGIDLEDIRKKLKKSKINYAYFTDEELYQTIFLPDFSTKDQVSNVSGRGIGLNAVADELEKFGGNVSVNSIYEKGTIFCITLPKFEYQNN